MRRLLRVLYFDIAGSATIEQHEKEDLLSLLWRSSALLARKQQVYMYNSWGDAVIFAFDAPDAALRCAFGLSKVLDAHGYRARAAATFGRVKLQHNPLRGSLDIISGSVDEAVRLEPAMKQLGDVRVLASESFRNHHQLDEVAFAFKEQKINLEKPFGNQRAGDRLRCYEAIDSATYRRDTRRARLRAWHSRPHIGAMNFEFSDEETAALTQELHEIVETDRYPFSLSRPLLRCSPRIRTLRGILAKLRPEPVRERLSFAQASIPKGSMQLLPPPKLYVPPRAALTRRRRAGP